MAERSEETRSDELYVGYLPVPMGVKRFLQIAAAVTAVLVALAAVVMARTQPSPGTGVWESTQERVFTGTIASKPYPMLYVEDRGDGKPGYVLLVEVGKHGGGKRAAGFDGKHISVSGWLLHRDGRFMLEMAPGEDAIREATRDRREANVPTKTLGRVTLRGEIVDSKCFLGAMKPGHGKTHKECATLCISGGIPPVLVVRGGENAPTYYVLTDEKGGALSSEAYPYIADPVEISGQLEEVGGTLRLRVRAADIRRL